MIDIGSNISVFGIKLMKCKSCKIYTMDTKCPSCGKSAVVSDPAKYSIDDKYGVYRRGLKFS